MISHHIYIEEGLKAKGGNSGCAEYQRSVSDFSFYLERHFLGCAFRWSVFSFKSSPFSLVLSIISLASQGSWEGKIVDAKKTIYFVSTDGISDIETFSLQVITIVLNTLRKETIVVLEGVLSPS